MWLVLSQGWRVSCILGVISALPVPVHHPEEGSGCRSGLPVAAVETSVATVGVSHDAGPHLTAVTFIFCQRGCSELRPLALVTNF